jgi:alkylated DNA repair dioxygenase AlkB
MEQLSFFAEAGQSKDLPADLVDYRPDFFNAEESRYFMDKLITDIPWQQKVVNMYGKKLLTPRLMLWMGEPGHSYSFSGEKHNPTPWTEDILSIKKQIEPIAGVTFNSVLLNYYRNGNDSMAWHSDNEPELGYHPLVASVTFGQVRNFDIRNKKDHAQKFSIKLENGSYLLMKGDLQENWEHRIAKSTKPMNARINLTFRVIKQIEK